MHADPQLQLPRFPERSAVLQGLLLSPPPANPIISSQGTGGGWVLLGTLPELKAERIEPLLLTLHSPPDPPPKTGSTLGLLFPPPIPSGQDPGPQGDSTHSSPALDVVVQDSHSLAVVTKPLTVQHSLFLLKLLFYLAVTH